MLIQKQLLDLISKLEKNELIDCPSCKSTGFQTDKAGIRHFCPTCKGWGVTKIPTPTFDIGYFVKDLNLN